MKTYKELMRQDFEDSLYRPLLSKYVNWFDVICLSDGERIEVNLSEGNLMMVCIFLNAEEHHCFSTGQDILRKF